MSRRFPTFYLDDGELYVFLDERFSDFEMRYKPQTRGFKGDSGIIKVLDQMEEYITNLNKILPKAKLCLRQCNIGLLKLYECVNWPNKMFILFLNNYSWKIMAKLQIINSLINYIIIGFEYRRLKAAVKVQFQ